MTDKEILEKAIQKAIERQYDMGGLLAPMDPGSYKVIAPFGGKHLVMELTNWQGDLRTESVNAIIFDHQFTKALWGDDTETGYEHECDVCSCDTAWYLPTWQYHLQQMVISEDPIKYLGDNI